MRIKFFWYKHPKTGEMLSDQRMVGYEAKPFVHQGVECELVKDYDPPKVEHDRNLAIIDKNREVFKADPQYVKDMNPKRIRFNDGHFEKYDSSKHC